MEDGKPRYVAALGRTDSREGWRENKRKGGILMSVEDQEVILKDLPGPRPDRDRWGRLHWHRRGASWPGGGPGGSNPGLPEGYSPTEITLGDLIVELGKPIAFQIPAGEALKIGEEIVLGQDSAGKDEPVVASVSKEKVNPDYGGNKDLGYMDLADIMATGLVASGTIMEPGVGKGPRGFQEQLWLAANSFELERRAFLKSIMI